MRADQDTLSVLHQKADGLPWTPPANYSLYPSPASRLFDPTPLDDPRLPIPSPSLYTYDLPELPTRDPQRFRPELSETKKSDSNLIRLPAPPVDEPAEISPGRAERQPFEATSVRSEIDGLHAKMPAGMKLRILH